MPIHEYRCEACLRDFEELVFGDDTPVCPHCSSGKTRKLLSRPCRAHTGDDGDDAGDFGASTGGGGCAGCSGGSCATCGH